MRMIPKAEAATGKLSLSSFLFEAAWHTAAHLMLICNHGIVWMGSHDQCAYF